MTLFYMRFIRALIKKPMSYPGPQGAKANGRMPLLQELRTADQLV